MSMYLFQAAELVLKREMPGIKEKLGLSDVFFEVIRGEDRPDAIAERIHFYIRKLIPPPPEKGCTAGFARYDNVLYGNMMQLPGCCGVCLSFHANLNYPYRGKKFGKYFWGLRREIASRAGYTVLLGTTSQAQFQQEKIFESSRLELVKEFQNRRTRNNIKMWIENLPEESSWPSGL